ncbi:hypothetical protein WR25_19644 [Diploscapter pachys]|uniref:Neurotransmitter-gated ion-channel transmembrane domain-containing protein n=1 Tax=Diploscapter pachys TaxID=2018661 RepID=A0A2A2LTQ0_9BILA|nr:hypothetical protein WR25_19644 [Diploscapter pachys]
MHLKRKTLYYGLNWIVPSVLISLSNIVGFTMPPECGEKITLQITNLLSVTVFLGMVSDVTPPTSESIPVIAAFLSINLVILGTSIIFTLVVVNIHFRSAKTHVMGAWSVTSFHETDETVILSDKKPLEKKVRIQEIEKLQSDNRLTLMEEMLAEILEILKAFKTLRDEEEEEEDQQSDWRFCAMVVDRFSLFLFTFLIFSFSAVVFFATPNILDAQPVIE